MTKLEDLPVYLYCEDPECTNKHFVSVNRDISGKYIIGYVEFDNYGCIGDLALNGSDTLEEAVTRMQYAIGRRKKRGHGLG